MPLISVIIPVYNTGKYLYEAIESVQNQDVEDIEIICVNDGSTDNSLDILNEMADMDKRIKVISQENQGQSAARNTAMPYAHGEYIYFMDSDDILCPGCFKTCLEHMERKGYDFVFFDADIFCTEGKRKLAWDYKRTGRYEENKSYDGHELMKMHLDNWTHRAVVWLFFIKRRT